MWTAVLNTLCICLPVIAFASPATLFIPLFCPAVLSRLKKNENAFSFYDYEANYDVDVDTSTLIEMSPLPLTTQMVSCYLFAIYAYHFEMWALLIPNSVGFVLGLFFASFYPLKVATKSLMRQWEIQYGLSVCIMVMGATTIHNIPYLSSSIAAVIGFIMCSYPLPVMQQSLSSGNPELLGSKYMNSAMLICCSAWVIHSSIIEYDIFVLSANTAGVVVQGAALVVRFLIARNSNRSDCTMNEGSPLL